VCKGRDPRGDLFHRCDDIDHAGDDRRIGHIRVQRSAAIAALRKSQASMLLDGFQSERAVAAASREQHADGGFALIPGERTQEHVDLGRLAFRRARLQRQPSVLDCQERIRRRQVDVVGLDRGQVGRPANRHGRVADQNFGKQALVPACQMGHHHERHAGVRGDAPEQFFQRLHASGRCADADNRKGIAACHPGKPPARSREPGGFYAEFFPNPSA
jgi:hypothetical protein